MQDTFARTTLGQGDDRVSCIQTKVMMTKVIVCSGPNVANSLLTVSKRNFSDYGIQLVKIMSN